MEKIKNKKTITYKDYIIECYNDKSGKMCYESLGGVVEYTKKDIKEKIDAHILHEEAELSFYD